jgi:hypothetical protein
MALTPTVSVASQAFPAVTAPQSFSEFSTPINVAVASVPTPQPSDVIYEDVPVYQDVNISLQAFNSLNRPEYIVLPNRKQNLPTSDPISPIVLQVMAFTAPNKIQVEQVTGGIVLPPAVNGTAPSGFYPSTKVIDLTSLSISLLGRQIAMVDKPFFLTPVPYFVIPVGEIPVNSPGGVPTTPTLNIAADDFQEADGAFIIGISGTNTLILSKSFNSSPAGAWLIIDQRLGFEAEVNDFAFQGTYTPEPFLPYPFPTVAPFLGDGGTFQPQFANSEAQRFYANAPQALPQFSPPQSPNTIQQPFIPNAPQAKPPILQFFIPADQAFDGVPRNFFQ